MMKFTYFIARNRFNMDEWLESNRINNFSKLVSFCEENNLSITPEECPSSIKAKASKPKPAQEKGKDTINTLKKPASKRAPTPKPASLKSKPASQNLADHGVYVDSNEAAKVELENIQRKRKIASKRSRSKNAGKKA